MKETNFKAYRNFLDAVQFIRTSSELDIIILGKEDVSGTIREQLDLYRNEFYEITLVTGQSEAQFAIDGQRYHPKGEPYICFVAPNQLQSYKMLGDVVGTDGYMIFFSKVIHELLVKMGAMSHFFKREFESYYQLSAEEYQILAFWLRLAHQEYHQASPPSQEIACNLLAVMLHKAKKILLPTKSALASRPNEVTDHFLDLISQHYTHKNVQFYADEMALTARQLNVVTKQTLGKTALKVIQEATIEKAKALILQSNYTISEILYQLGFDELSKFSRLFKRITGHSPNTFKANYKK